MSDDDVGTRVWLSKAELLHLKDFAANVDDADHDAWWAQLTAKLENAVSRVDKRLNAKPPRVRHSYRPDDQPARCRACGWEGTLTKSGPCPSCGKKTNPFLYLGRHCQDGEG